MTVRDDILARLRVALPDLRHRFPIASLGVFGSFARDEARDGSDIDILVEFEHPVPFSRFFALEEELASLTGRHVDLATPRALKPAIKDRVMHDLVAV